MRRTSTTRSSRRREPQRLNSKSTSSHIPFEQYLRRHDYRFATLLARDVREKPKDTRLGVIADLSVSFLERLNRRDESTVWLRFELDGHAELFHTKFVIKRLKPFLKQNNW